MKINKSALVEIIEYSTLFTIFYPGAILLYYLEEYMNIEYFNKFYLGIVENINELLNFIEFVDDYQTQSIFLDY
tara:strand:- start:2472 stop:2693 length:222 start_codon:yes stop_codon:yes gene_type:complete